MCNELFALNLLKHFDYNLTGELVFNEISDISTTYEDTVVACVFRNNLSTCYEYLDEILTEKGKCFTFNLLAPEEIFQRK